jgi:hypothetical protein
MNNQQLRYSPLYSKPPTSYTPSIPPLIWPSSKITLQKKRRLTLRQQNASVFQKLWRRHIFNDSWWPNNANQKMVVNHLISKYTDVIWCNLLAIKHIVIYPMNHESPNLREHDDALINHENLGYHTFSDKLMSTTCMWTITNVGNPIINLPLGDGLYNWSLVIWGILYCWIYYITSDYKVLQDKLWESWCRRTIRYITERNLKQK